MKNHKGISGVITAVLMIALVMAVAIIVWVVVRNLVQENLEGVESCFGIYDKVKINNMYTCYDSLSNEFQFSISVGDITLDSIVISVSSEGTTKSYTITNQNKSITGLRPYSSSGNVTGNVTIPKANSGLTYISTEFATKPDSIEIAPIIKKEQCDVSDSLYEIDECAGVA